MLASIAISFVLALQGAPAAKPVSKPATPIAAAPAGESGPTLQVPADLARLTSPSTIAVLYVPDISRGDDVIKRLADAAGPNGAAALTGNSVKQMLKQSVRTDLDIPLDQPVLWWIDMPEAQGDEPPMGMGEVVFHQAFKIPGAQAAMDKARADAAASNDPKVKSRPVMPIRARGRQGTVTVLPGDVVVISSDMEPFEMKADAPSSALLERLPLSAACGRVDIGRGMAEQGDQLKMLGGFAAMALSGDAGGADESKLSDADKRRMAMKRVLGEAVGKQIDSTITALMQLKRATFALNLQGDELMLWSDWSRDAAFPAGLDEATVKSLAAKLPAGMPIYAGISTNAMMTMYSDKLTIDDALVTMGSTPDEKKAWDECMGKAQSMLGMIEGGAVMGVSINDATTSALISLRVKDAAAFRTTLADTMALLAKTGWGTVKLENAGDTMTLTTTANAQRVKDVMDVFNTGPVAEEVAAAQEQALAQATQPQTIVMTFKGNEVLMTQSQGGKPMDMAAKPGATDIRNTLGANAWGTADWFATLELRALMANIMAQPGIEGLEAFKDLANGMPVTVRAWQGVQGNTTRLTLQANLKEVQTFVADMEAAAKKAEAKAGKGGKDEDEDEDDDDDDEDEDEKGEGKDGAKPGQDKD